MTDQAEPTRGCPHCGDPMTLNESATGWVCPHGHTSSAPIPKGEDPHELSEPLPGGSPSSSR